MDAYNKLRPWTEIERCECVTTESLVLVDLLTDNPIHCGVCRKEIDPERLQLSLAETEAIASWFSAASALYRLWLHSGEYEHYAKQKLIDPKGQTNLDGLKLAQQLSVKWPTRLWFFHDADDGEPTHCPVCGTALNVDVDWGLGRCDQCKIHV